MMRKITAGGGGGQKYTQKSNRNIKLLSPAKSIVLLIQREKEGKRERKGAGTEIAWVSSSLKRLHESLSALSLLITCSYLFFFSSPFHSRRCRFRREGFFKI